VERGKTVTEARRVKEEAPVGGAASPVSRGLPQKEPGRGVGWGGRYLTVTAGATRIGEGERTGTARASAGLLVKQAVRVALGCRMQMQT
jgi:hypothetical protein